MSEKIIGYGIHRDVLEDGTEIFDVYAQYVGGSECLESFYDKSDAEAYVKKREEEDGNGKV